MQNQKPAIDFCEPAAGCDDGENGVEFVNPSRRSPRQIVSCGRNRANNRGAARNSGSVSAGRCCFVGLRTAFTWLCLSGESDIPRPEDIRPESRLRSLIAEAVIDSGDQSPKSINLIPICISF
jgi:hypothetical protein